MCPVTTGPKWYTDANINVTEEQSSVVADLHAQVEDPGRGGTYAIKSGADADLFVVDPTTGLLSFKDGAIPDFENPSDADGDNVYEVAVEATSSQGYTSCRVFQVTIRDGNEAPVITSDEGGDDAIIRVDENTTFVTDVNATDATNSEGNGLTYSISGEDADLFQIDASTGSLTFQEAPDFENPQDVGADNMYSVNVTVTDTPQVSLLPAGAVRFNDSYYFLSSTRSTWQNAQSEAESYEGHLVTINDAEEQSFIAQQLKGSWASSVNSYAYIGTRDTVQEGQWNWASGEDVTYTNFDGSIKTYEPGQSSVSGPSYSYYDYGLIQESNGQWFDYYGSYSYHGIIEVPVSALQSTDTQELTIKVNDTQANGVDDTASTPKDTPVTINILDNDSGSQGGDLQIDSVSSPMNGTASLNADGTVTYTPNAGFSGGMDQFTYSITDQFGETDTVTVTVNVSDTNTAPVSTADSANTNEDTPVTIDVLPNDSDINNDSLSITGVAQPSNGSTSVVNGKIVYTPDADFNGSDTFEYTISDGEGGSSTASVTVNVAAVNDNPVANDDARATAQSQAILVDVLGNDTDVDGDSLSVSAVGNDAQNGISVLTSSGQVLYMPNPGFVGVDTFTYTVSDGQGGTDTATVSITVGDPNTAPTAADDTGSTISRSPVTIDVLSNDTDTDGDALSIDNVDAPANGTATVVDGKVVYTPNAGFTGTDSFGYTINDGEGGTDTATINVTVAAGPNVDPTAKSDNGSTIANTPVTLNVLGNDSDANGDDVSLESVDAPLNGSVEVVDGKVVYTPNDGFVGTDAFNYTINDGNGGTSTTQVRVAVDPNPNQVPVGVHDIGTTTFDTAITIDAVANDSDPDGDDLSISKVDSPANGSVEIVDGQLVYTPNAGFSGLDVFDYTISDGNGGTTKSCVTVLVEDEVAAAIGEISGQVRNDVDGDGDLSDADSGIAGVTLQLFADADQNYRPDGAAIATITTDANGNYAFTNVDAGTYIVEQVNLDGFVSTADTNGFNLDRIGGLRVNDNTINGQDFLDTLAGNAPKTDIFGTPENDQLWGSSDSENIFGLAGNDVIGGGAGDDNIFGDAGNDVVLGGAGDDILNGTNGTFQGIGEKDTLKGGSGADTFVLGDENHAFYGAQGYGDRAWIQDFNANEDSVQLWGAPELYEMRVVNGNTQLFCKPDESGKSPELIATFANSTGLDLNSFQYVGDLSI